MANPDHLDIRRFRLEETYKSLTGLGTEVLKALILVNGAAAAGELTFIGSILEKHKEALPGLVWGLQAYALGVGLAAFAFTLGFISQAFGYRADRIGGSRALHHGLLYVTVLMY